MNRPIIILLILITCFSITSDIQKKIIRQDGFDIECYVYLKAIDNTKKGRNYYWFKSGQVHQSNSSSGGLVLHNSFKKYYRSKQIAEIGNFEYGLKTNAWKSWHENGNLKTYTDWKDGLKHGNFMLYDETGVLVQSGTYNKNIKTEYWINHQTHDTLYFKKDSVYTTKPKSKTGLFLYSIFKKQDSTEKAQQKIEKQLSKEQDSIKKAQKKAERNKKNKDTTSTGFFNNLFKKSN